MERERHLDLDDDMKPAPFLLVLSMVGCGYARADDLADCRAQSQGIKIEHPGKVMQAIADATAKCMAQRERVRQSRQIALYKHALAACGDSITGRMKRENLPEASREPLVQACVEKQRSR